MKSIDLRGCNTAGGLNSTNEWPTTERLITYAKKNHIPIDPYTFPYPSRNNIANNLAQMLPGIAVIGNEGILVENGSHSTRLGETTYPKTYQYGP